MSKSWTIAVDFDGVLHSYTTSWINAHTIPDPPVPGALEWLLKMVQCFEVVILSTRCKTWRGRRAIRAWLKHHAGELWWYDTLNEAGIERVRCSYEKLPALMYIDDRAFRFTGSNFPEAHEIHEARPWNKEGR